MSSESYFARLDQLSRLPFTAQVKLVLHRIVCYGGDANRAFPSQERLANDVSLSVRQLRRHLNKPIHMGVLKVQRRKHETAVYSVDWTVVRSITQDRTPMSHQGASRGDANVPSCEIKTGHPRHQDRTSKVLKTGHRCPTEHKGTQTNTNSKGSGLKTDRSKGGLWSIDPGEFKSLDRGHARFESIVKAGVLGPEDELRFLVLWLWAGRKRNRNPVGALRKCICQREWNGPTEIEDEVIAWQKAKHAAGDGPPLSCIQRLEESTKPEYPEIME